MIALDTNIVSELMRPRPAVQVLRWIARQPRDSLFLTTITEAELRYGAALLPAGKRREALEGVIEETVRKDFASRVLEFDSDAARMYAVVSIEHRRAGRPITVFDAQIAAIARSRGARLATRNNADFEYCGLIVINPWVDGFYTNGPSQ